MLANDLADMEAFWGNAEEQEPPPGRYLFLQFIGDSMSYWDVASMAVEDLEWDISDVRSFEPDRYPLSDHEIAERILAYARRESAYYAQQEEE